MDESIQPQDNKSSLKFAQKTEPIESNTMNTSNTSIPPDSEMCLRWNSHHSNMQTIFPNLLQNEKYVDVTLAADGQLIKCHKLVLSSCSEYFDEIFKDTYPMQHTVMYLRGIPFWIVKALVDFMYKGEVNIDQIKLEPLLKAAEDLQIKGLAGKAKMEKEPDDKPTIPEQKKPKETFEKKLPEQKPLKEIPDKKPEQKQFKFEKILKKEAKKGYIGIDDDDDDDYTPYRYYKKKLQSKKIRKRKFASSPDPLAVKQVKVNLKGTKSRPNIKQPKFYDPDYPNKFVSPPKLDSNDPIFNIDNIKMEPIDFEVPTSPSYSEISSLMDQSLSECASLEKIKTEKTKPMEITPVEEPKKIKKYAGKVEIIPKPNFTQDKQTIFQTACSSIDVQPTVTNKETEDKSDPNDKNTILLNVLNKNTDNTSFKKVIDIKKPLNTSDVEKPTFSQIRVRKLSTTDQVLKKFASTHLTSILKKDSVPVILRRVSSSSKPVILRHSTPKKIEIIKADSPEIAEKLSALAKTKKELTSTDVSNVSQTQVETPEKQPEIEPQNVTPAEKLTDSTTEKEN